MNGSSYMGLSEEYVHEVINHAEKYVDGRVHTNGLENFWCLLKRGLGGTYVSVEPFHLYRYLDEQMFRYNHRKDGTAKYRQRTLRSGHVASRWQASDLQPTHRQRRIAALRNDRGGGNASALLVLVGKTRFPYTLSAGRSLPLLPFLGLYNFGFGNAEQGLHPFFKVFRAFGPSMYSGVFISVPLRRVHDAMQSIDPRGNPFP